MTDVIVDEGPMQHEHVDDGFRIPSQYPRCRRAHCLKSPVCDMKRSEYRYRGGRGVEHETWWAYCATHLREYNREVRGDQVWWLGSAGFVTVGQPVTR